MFFQKDVETMKRKDIEALQLEKLRHMVDYCYRNVPFYTKSLMKLMLRLIKSSLFLTLSTYLLQPRQICETIIRLGCLQCP